MIDYEKCRNCDYWNPDYESPERNSCPIDACALCEMSEEDFTEYAEQLKGLKKTEESGTKEKSEIETDWHNFIMQRMETVK